MAVADGLSLLFREAPMRSLLLATAFCLPALLAHAQDAAPAEAPSIWERANLLGDMGGLRSRLSDHGVTLTLLEQSEFMGNVSGGYKQGSVYDGQTTLTVQVDMEKAFGLKGGTFNISALDIHGHGLSNAYLGNLQTVSGASDSTATRLWELWYQQSFADGAFDVKLGQQAVDQDFINSSNSAMFYNTMMGWPMLPSADLYAGGPASPLSALGVRVHVQATDEIGFLAGVFDDNPPGGPFNNDSQLRGLTRSGLNFGLRTGALFIAEVQYLLNQKAPGADKLPDGLPTALKFGFYADTGDFYDQRYDTNGVSLASARSNGTPRKLSGNSAVYALLDQGLWRAAPDSPRLLSVFARVLTAPSDRNLIDTSVDGGVTLAAPLPGRDDDMAGLGFGYAHVSSRAAGYDQDVRLGNSLTPVRSSEWFLEATYQAAITPWLQLQPDVQYVIRPGGGVLNPLQPTQKIKDELVFGLRANITF